MNLPVFDLHCDTALELLDSQCRPVERLKRRRGHIDLERGGKLPAYAQLFAFFTTPDMDATGRFSPEMIFDAMLSNLQRELQENRDQILQARTPAEIRQAVDGGKIAAVFSLEGPAGIGFDPGRLEELAALGFCMTTLTWNECNPLAGSHKTGGGLTARGKEYVRRAQSYGMALDVSPPERRGLLGCDGHHLRPCVRQPLQQPQSLSCQPEPDRRDVPGDLPDRRRGGAESLHRFSGRGACDPGDRLPPCAPLAGPGRWEAHCPGRRSGWLRGPSPGLYRGGLLPESGPGVGGPWRSPPDAGGPFLEQCYEGAGIMLYVTTLDRTVTYTAQATLERATGPEGGLFVPMTLPQYDRKGLAAVLALPFWDCVASILNQFFPLRLQGSSLQGTEGVLPEPVYIRYKIAVAELWDRKTGSFRAFGPTCATGWAPSSAPGGIAFVAGGHCAAVWPLRRCVPGPAGCEEGSRFSWLWLPGSLPCLLRPGMPDGWDFPWGM